MLVECFVVIIQNIEFFIYFSCHILDNIKGKACWWRLILQSICFVNYGVFNHGDVCSILNWGLVSQKILSLLFILRFLISADYSRLCNEVSLVEQTTPASICNRLPTEKCKNGVCREISVSQYRCQCNSGYVLNSEDDCVGPYHTYFTSLDFWSLCWHVATFILEVKYVLVLITIEPN